MNKKLTETVSQFNKIGNKDNSKRIIVATLKPNCDNRPNDIIVTG